MSTPPRCLQVLAQPEQPVIIYSDASFEPGKPVTCGWVVFHPEWTSPVGQSIQLSEADTDRWVERATDIFPAEACCGVLVPHNLPQAFLGRDVTCFVDNEAAAAALIRGGFGAEDVDLLSQLAHLAFMPLQARVWFEWVDSEANPADGLSRLGLDDPWTRAQGWVLFHESHQTGLHFTQVSCLLEPEGKHWAYIGLAVNSSVGPVNLSS